MVGFFPFGLVERKVMAELAFWLDTAHTHTPTVATSCLIPTFLSTVSERAQGPTNLYLLSKQFASLEGSPAPFWSLLISTGQVTFRHLSDQAT